MDQDVSVFARSTTSPLPGKTHLVSEQLNAQTVRTIFDTSC